MRAKRIAFSPSATTQVAAAPPAGEARRVKPESAQRAAAVEGDRRQRPVWNGAPAGGRVRLSEAPESQYTGRPAARPVRSPTTPTRAPAAAVQASVRKTAQGCARAPQERAGKDQVAPPKDHPAAVQGATTGAAAREVSSSGPPVRSEIPGSRLKDSAWRIPRRRRPAQGRAAAGGRFIRQLGRHDIRDVQHFGGAPLGVLGAAVVASGGDHVGVPGELLHAGNVGAGIKQLADEAAPQVVRSLVRHVGVGGGGSARASSATVRSWRAARGARR